MRDDSDPCGRGGLVGFLRGFLLSLDADSSSLLASMLRYGIALPALVSAAVLLASWPLWRRTTLPQKGAWSVALALGLGCAAGQIGVEGSRSFPPREAADRLFYLTLAAVALDVLDLQRFCPSWLRGALRVLLWLAVVWSLLPPALRMQASGGVLASWLLGLGLAGLLFWFALALTARRLPGTTMLLLFIVSAGTVGVLTRGHSVTLTQLAGVLTAALLPILISVLQTLPGDIHKVGMTMLLGFTVSFGFILPINAPQNMVCLGTETFNGKQFARIGVPVTVAGYALMLLFAVTYWRWLGWT